MYRLGCCVPSDAALLCFTYRRLCFAARAGTVSVRNPLLAVFSLLVPIIGPTCAPLSVLQLAAKHGTLPHTANLKLLLRALCAAPMRCAGVDCVSMCVMSCVGVPGLSCVVI